MPKADGGTDDIDNAIPLCANCHAEVHRSYAPGNTARSYSPQELKLHREWLIAITRKEKPTSYDDRIEELIKILELRAAVIERDLQKQHKTSVSYFLPIFLDLHREHVHALRQGQFVLAHEILQKINDLSYNLETSEVGANLKPGVDYAMLSSEHYSRGALMCGYVAGDVHRKSRSYPGEGVLRWIHPKFLERNVVLGGLEDIEERYLRLFLAPASLGSSPI